MYGIIHYERSLCQADRFHLQSLDRAISNAVQRHVGKSISAFMLMSLDEDGDIAIHSSKHVKSWTDSVFPLNAGEQLRHAHKVTSADAKTTVNDEGRRTSLIR